ALHTIERDHVGGRPVARVHRRGETEVCRQAFRAELPCGLARVAPIDLFVHAHEAKATLLGMREQLVDAVKDVWPLTRGAVHLVVLHPGHPTVLGAVHAADADADLHLLRIGRVDRDRVEAHTPPKPGTHFARDG